MKPILFLGCSFTWGQGLWYYGDFNISDKIKNNSYDSSLLTQNQIDYKDCMRFSRKVATYFDTIEIQNHYNGGTNPESIEMVYKILNSRKFNTFNQSIYNIKEISYIIFQFTQEHRGCTPLHYDNEKYIMSTKYISDSECNIEDMILDTNDNIKKQMYNGYTTAPPEYHKDLENGGYDLSILLDNTINFELNHLFNIIVPILEDNNIQMFFISWPDSYAEQIYKKFPLFTNRLISLEYNGKKYNSIEALQNNHDEMRLSGCDEIQLGKDVVDEHPSKKCHQVIANSIISHIEEYEKNISNR